MNRGRRDKAYAPPVERILDAHERVLLASAPHEARILEVQERARVAAADRGPITWRSPAMKLPANTTTVPDSPRQTYAIVGVGTGRVKIGSAKSIMTRGLALQTGSPVELVLVGYCAVDIESYLHMHLHESRSHLEWFHLDNKVRKTIASNMQRTYLSFLDADAYAHWQEHDRNPGGDLFR